MVPGHLLVLLNAESALQVMIVQTRPLFLVLGVELVITTSVVTCSVLLVQMLMSAMVPLVLLQVRLLHLALFGIMLTQLLKVIVCLALMVMIAQQVSKLRVTLEPTVQLKILAA